MRFKCPPILLFLFFFGNITVVAKIPGKVDKAFESLQDFNYFEAKKLFEKSQNNYPCLSSYGLSLIFFRNDNPFHNVDSAYFRIKQSIVAYMSPSKNEIAKLLEHNVDGNVLQGVKTGVEKLAYQNAVGSLDIEKLNHFLGVYIGAAGYADAARKRDSLAFDVARKENNSSSYYQFMQNYNDSYLFPEAKTRYEKTLYDESVFDGKEASYARFITAYPNSPHVQDAMTKLYVIYTNYSNVPEVYYNFILKYPTNIHVEDAWQKLFDFNVVSFNESNINSFLARYPDYPERVALNSELKLLLKTVLPFKQEMFFGLMDSEGKTVMEPKYDFIGKFHEGIAIVTLGGKMGFINKDGEEIIPPFYDDAENFSNNVAVVGEANRYGAIIRNGRMVVPLIYDEIDDFSGGFAAVSDGKTVGYINRTGNIVIPFKYEFGGAFSHGKAICQLDDLYGVINEKGDTVISFRYDEIERFSSHIFKITLNDQSGLLGNDGTVLLDPVYDEIGPLFSQRAIVVKSGQLGYLNDQGKVVIEPGYDSGRDAITRSRFQNGLAVVRKKNRCGVIDSAGNQLLAFRYDDISLVADSIIAVKQSGKWGLMNLSSGKILLAPKFGFIQAMNGNNIIVTQKGRSGLIDISGKILLPFNFQSLSWLNSESLAGKKNGKFGVVNLAGEELIPFESDQFLEKEENYFEFSSAVSDIWFDVLNNRVFKHQ